MGRIRLLEIVGNAEGGGTKCVARIVTHLDPERYDITVISPDSPWLADVCREHGATYRPLPLRSSRIKPAIYAAMASMLAHVEPDIISAHGTRAAWYTLRALPTVASGQHFMYSEHLFSFDARRGMFRQPWIALEGYICRRAQVVATACEANARFIEQHGWKRSEEIAMRHYGIELDDFRWQAANKVTRAELNIPENALVVGTVGRLIPQKGMRYLLEAASLVLRSQRNVVFLIVGDGVLRADLEAQCHQLGIADNVRFLGAHAQPWRILANADVIAFSSLFEGLPQTCIEALAVGSAVVATHMNGTAQLITPGHNGILVPTRHAEALAQGILGLLRDPDLRRHFGRHGPAAVEDFRTETMIARFDEAYRSLCAQQEAISAGARTSFQVHS